MIPTIKFIYNKKTAGLDVRIKIYGLPYGVYSTGILVDENSFDAKKQICGDPSVMEYINLTRESIRKAYRPGMSPEQMWADYLSHTGKKATLADAFQYYLDSKELAPSSRSTYTYLQSMIEKAGWVMTTLENITPAKVRLFINSLDMKQSTKALYLSSLHAVITLYIRDHNLDIRLNLDGIVEKQRKKEADEEESEYLEFDEVKKLLTIENLKVGNGKGRKAEWFSEARDLFVIMCFTGLSVGDIVKFTPQDMISADGKWILYKRTKTKKRGKRCRVPMLPITRSLIYKYDWPTRLPIRTIQWYCNKLGTLIGKRITPHTARHSFGGIMLYFGFSMESVREMMGHSSVAITEQIYAKVTKAKIEREMKEIPEMMNKMLTL